MRLNHVKPNNYAWEFGVSRKFDPFSSVPSTRFYDFRELEMFQDDFDLKHVKLPPLGPMISIDWNPSFRTDTLWLCQNSYRKSPFLIGKPGKPSINGPFSIAILVYQRVFCFLATPK